VFFGLVQDTKVMNTYAHLVAKDANDAVLRMYGVQQDEKPIRPESIRCGMCQEVNPSGRFCVRCGYPLHPEAMRPEEERLDQAGELIRTFLERPEIRALFGMHVQSLGPPPPHGSQPPAPPRPRPRPELAADAT